ncbi:MAG: Ig-like domain-containing protein [Gemmatimonadaceae bacterium]
MMIRRSPSPWLSRIAPLLAFLYLGCSDAASPSAAVPVVIAPVPKATLVTVITSVQTTRVGTKARATASVYDQFGSLMATKVPTWTIEGGKGLATIDATGVIAALTAGTIQVVATVDGARGESPIVITPPPSVAFVRVTLDSTSLLVGRTTHAHVSVLDSIGTEIVGSSVKWSIAAGSATATIGGQGVVTAIAPGTARVIATVAGVTGEALLTIIAPSTARAASVSVTVTPAVVAVGMTTQAQFVALDSAGIPLVGRTATWSIPGGSTIASISSAGLVTALAPGSARIVAKIDSVTGEARLSVVNKPAPIVAKVSVTLDASSVVVGGTTQAHFEALDSIDLVIPGKAATWKITEGGGVATVSNSGVVSGIAVGRAGVVAHVDGVAGSVAINVRSPTSSGNSITLPDGLRDSLRFNIPRPTGRTWQLKRGDNLQSALDNAQRGDEIVLEAGATFTGTFTLPAKAGSAVNGWILLRSSAQSQLPARGTRVRPSNASAMARIVTPNAQAAIQTAPRASGWWITGVEVTVDSTFNSNNYGLVLLGDGSSVQNSITMVPSDLVLDRVYIHSSGHVGTSRCVGMNSARTVVEDSYLMNCRGKGFDTQAIGGWNGPGPYRIVNNMLAGAGENVMFGGADPAIYGLVPSDIEIRRNYIYTPASWQGTWSKKNLLELKNARRVLIEGNVLDGSWPDAQVGFGFMLYSTNQSGACRWCRVTDVMIHGNLLKNVAGGYNISGGQTVVDTATRRIALIDNVVDSLKYSNNNILLQLLANGYDLTVDSLVAVGGGGLVRQFMVVDPNPGWTNLVYRNAVVEHGTYGLFSSVFAIGEASLSAVAGTMIYRNVQIIGATRPGYPTSTFIARESQAPLAASIRSRVSQATSGVELP